MPIQFAVANRLPGAGIKVASFFSGAGGLDLGFHEAGFNIVFCNEIEPLFCDTLHQNYSDHLDSPRILCKDIRELDAADLPSEVDLVIGGPPCQTFSASGRRAGGAAGRLDPRGTLFEAYCRLLRKMRPVGFVFENVRGILGTNCGKDWKQIVRTFETLSYRVSYRVVDACDYGIPQHRERLILVGHRLDGGFLFPEPTHGPDSLRDASHLSPALAFEDIPERESLEALALEGGKYSHLLREVPPGGNYLHFTAKRGCRKPIFAYRSRFSDFLYKAHPDYPIKTLIASPGKYTGPFHWDNRRFSLAEYKRLQGFPDDYEFCGNRSEVVRQIGNSVSPKLSRALALAIAKQIFHRDVDVGLMSPVKSFSFDRRKGQTAQQTRQKHLKVARKRREGQHTFEVHSYSARVEPCYSELPNVVAEAAATGVTLRVRGDGVRRLFAKMVVEINQHERDLFTPLDRRPDAQLSVHVYGSEPQCVQTMWNAIDDWVIRSSNFHSLYELYGHFTEPHPIFSIAEFNVFSDHPMARFAVHASKFENCSRYFNRVHLTRMFGDAFGTRSFADLAMVLRQFRFDIRCRETNIAISPDLYMVAYPFTLPHRKQMNFSVRNTIGNGADAREARS